jgi:Icc protein
MFLPHCSLSKRHQKASSKALQTSSASHTSNTSKSTLLKTLFLATLPVILLLSGCEYYIKKVNLEQLSQNPPFSIPLTTGQHQDEVVYLRIAILGDAEPKPLAEFPNMRGAIEQINALHQTEPIDFVIGVGDIAHEGTDIQYEASMVELQKFTVPFYPIMGNEEHNESVEKYLGYAQKWNPEIISSRYVMEGDSIAFIFASPGFGREFEDEGVLWIRDQLQAMAPKPVFLIVHGAQAGAFPENPEKGVHNPLFVEEVVSQPNLTAMISGDLHMDMERVNHSKQIGSTHYLHIPGVERTKIPDETNHTPMFRVMTITQTGQVLVDTYTVGESEPRESLAYSFEISFAERSE